MECHFLAGGKNFEFEWEFYAQLASYAIFRARTYDCITYSVGDDDYLMNETRRKETSKGESPMLNLLYMKYN